MGANASKQQAYGYGYGAPQPGYGGAYNGMYGYMPPTYRKTRRRGTYPQYYTQPPTAGYPGGVLPMAAYPAMYPQVVAQPQFYYPMYTQPMMQVPGRPIFPQAQTGMQPGAALQPAGQPEVSQPTVQMPEPQVQPGQPRMPPAATPGLASGAAPGPPPGPMPMLTPNVGPQPPGTGPFPAPLAGAGPSMQMPEPGIPLSGPSLAPPMVNDGPVIPGAPPGIIPTPRPSADYNNPPPMNGISGPMPGPAPGSVPMPEPGIGPGPIPGPGGFTSPPDGDFPSSTTASDPLDRNPLPTPPREIPIPEHLVTDSAMTHHSVRMPVPASEDLPPLRNPLPKLPKDVYDSRRYRELTVGNASRYQNPRRVYPDGWFDREDGLRSRPILGRTLTGTFAKLNPFRHHQGRPSMHQRYNTMPVPTVPGAPGMGPDGGFSTETDELDGTSEEGIPNGPFTWGRNTRRALSRRMPFRFGRHNDQDPPSGFMTMPRPTISNAVGPQPMHPFSPDRRGTPPPPIRFDRNHPQLGGFALTSPHMVLYKNKLYPTAYHLFEAHKFLNSRSSIADRLRAIDDIGELRDYVEDQQFHVRQDWGAVQRDKLDDVLRLKFIQHRELRDALFATDSAELICSDPDQFWGKGPTGEGQNELGKALMRVRERLRQEGAGIRY